jgi:hypothetical protein
MAQVDWKKWVLSLRAGRAAAMAGSPSGRSKYVALLK